MSERTATTGAVIGRDSSLDWPVAERAGWDAVDVRAADTFRLLAADAVQKVGSGRPGTAMSLAPLAYLLFHRVMRHDPNDDLGAILNGIALQSLTRPYGGTFLVFSDYMRPAVRLAALMQLPATYVWTHEMPESPPVITARRPASRPPPDSCAPRDQAGHPIRPVTPG
jgi:hypothetical protein